MQQLDLGKEQFRVNLCIIISNIYKLLVKMLLIVVGIFRGDFEYYFSSIGLNIHNMKFKNYSSLIFALFL